jgi:hypothetical protein
MTWDGYTKFKTSISVTPAWVGSEVLVPPAFSTSHQSGDSVPSDLAHVICCRSLIGIYPGNPGTSTPSLSAYRDSWISAGRVAWGQKKTYLS